MPSTQLSAFFAIALLLVLTPGADTMLVLRSVVAHGTRAGLSTVAGIATGCAVHAMLSAAGLSAIVMTSIRAFDVLKIAGAAYLVFLGVQSLRSAVTVSVVVADDRDVAESPRSFSRAFVDGLMTNLLNPKVAIFYLAFLPQFIDPRGNLVVAFALLAGIHIAIGVVWLSALTVAFDRLRVWVTSARARRGLEAIAGVALIGLGLRLATARR